MGCLPPRCPAEPGSFRPGSWTQRAVCWLLGYCRWPPGRRLKQRRQQLRQQWEEEQAAAAAQDGDLEGQREAAPAAEAAAAAGADGVNVKAQQGPPRRHKSLLGLPILSPGKPRGSAGSRAASLLCCCFAAAHPWRCTFTAYWAAQRMSTEICRRPVCPPAHLFACP